MKLPSNLEQDESILNDSLPFAFLHNLFRYPTSAQWEWITQTDVRTALGVLFQQYGITNGQDANLYPASYEEYEESYIRLFEVGAPCPDCPLIESHWNKKDPTPKVLHENILFYKAFGLRMKKEAEETSDHLRFQLEFYRHLITLAAETADSPERADHYQQIMQARRDYLQRHLVNWVPLAVEKVIETAPETCFANWMRLLSACIADQFNLVDQEIQNGSFE